MSILKSKLMNTTFKRILDIIISILAIVIIIVGGIFTSQVKKFDLKLSFERGDNHYTEYSFYEPVEGIDLYTDGLDLCELEIIFNSFKLWYEIKIKCGWDSLHSVHLNKIYELWNLEAPVVSDPMEDVISDRMMIDKIISLFKQYEFRAGFDYVSQRVLRRDIANRACVPTSFAIIVRSMGYKVDPEKLTDFFRFDGDSDTDIDEYLKIKRFAEQQGKWTEDWIKSNRLYQITSIFAYGTELYMDKYFPDFEFKLHYNYWSIDKINKYIKETNLPVMSATYLPSMVRSKRRDGGHMVVLDTILSNGQLVACKLQDPFGNPNLIYSDTNGRNVIVSFGLMVSAMKSQRDDHPSWKNARTDIYRILYFMEKES